MMNLGHGRARWTPFARPGATLRRGERGRRGRLRVLTLKGDTPLDSRANGTTALRLLMALLVIYGHSHVLGGFGENPISRLSDGQISIGELAVAGFFIISGVFIAKSFAACGSVWRFLWHRAVRILPGYWTCLLLTTGLLGAIAYQIEYGSVIDYFRQGIPFPYIHQNLFLLIKLHAVGHLFLHNPLPRTFNDSLWTLEVEARCYIAIALLGALGILTRARILVPLMTVALWFLYLHGAPAFYAHNLLVPNAHYTAPYLYFAIGSACYLYRDRLRLTGPLTLLAVVLIGVSFRTGTVRYLLPPAFSYLLLYSGFASPLRRLALRTDLSYGMYIYAFPTQQLLALVGVNRFGFAPFCLCAILLTLPLACLSWYAIEQPCLRLKNLHLLPRARWPGRPERRPGNQERSQHAAPGTASAVPSARPA